MKKVREIKERRKRNVSIRKKKKIINEKLII